MDGAFSVELKTLLHTATGRGVTNTAVGGATMAEIAARIAANPDLARQCQLIIWDGSPNSYGSVAAYLAYYATIAASMGAGNFLFIPPVRRAIMSAQENTDTSLIQAGIAAAYPSNFVDAQAVLAAAGNPVSDATDIANNYVPDSLLQVDNVHLLQAGLDPVVTAIQTWMSGAGWH